MLGLKAHAKVNLGLSVLARRADGYHELDTLFARLELHDLVRLESAESGIRLEAEGAALPSGPDNLAYRAAQTYLDAAGERRGVRIRLEKRIPLAAGLGGGSSDAAAVLRGLARLYPADVDLQDLALALGSDVPFFARDVPAARAGGRGERLEPLALPGLHLVLANPGIEVSAGDAYAALRAFTPTMDLAAIARRLRRCEEPGYINALQPGVVGLEPEIGQVLSALRAAGLRGVLMSGSGSTCFGLSAGASEAQRAAEALRGTHPGWWIRATRTV